MTEPTSQGVPDGADTLPRADQSTVAGDQVRAEAERRQRYRRARTRPGGRRGDDIPKDYVSVTEYAHRHSVDRRTVYKWMTNGNVDFYQVEALIRIRNVPPRNEGHTLAVHPSTS